VAGLTGLVMGEDRELRSDASTAALLKRRAQAKVTADFV